MSEVSQAARGANPCPRSLHRFAQGLVALTFLLITVGGLVTSNDAGLSVPDWPTTYGHNMFTFPLSGMVGGILYEHGHRLLASGVGFLTIILAVWLTLSDPRRRMKVFGWTALGAVILQGILGGLTVRFYLPPAISVSHSALALIYFCLTITIAFATSPRWTRRGNHAAQDPAVFFRFSMAVLVLLFIQILMGAYMRHTWDSEFGLAVTGFPLSNGQLIPEFTDSVVIVHFIHRWFAFAVMAVILAFVWRVLPKAKQHPHLLFPAMILMTLIFVQVLLGVFTVLTERMTWITTLHQANGALLFGVTYMIVLRSRVPCCVENREEEPANESRSNDYALQT